jgi:hypothetical protein
LPFDHPNLQRLPIWRSGESRALDKRLKEIGRPGITTRFQFNGGVVRSILALGKK